MPRQQKMTVGRFLKRNALYFFAVFVLLALVGVILLSVRFLRSFGADARPEIVENHAEEEASLPPEEADPPEDAPPEDVPPVEETPPEPGWQENGEFIAPFEGTTVTLVGQKLALTYDPGQLKLSESGGLYTLLPASGGKLPRMDMQQLSSSLDALTDEELDRLATGVLQAYYYAAPKTEDIVLSETEKTENSYFTVLDAPAYENAPAMRAKFRLIQAGAQLWYAIVLLPEDADTAAVEQAFDYLMFR